jgi:hypothetical protein
MLRRVVVSAVVLMGLLWLTGSNALAAPTNSQSPNLFVGPVSCNNGQTFTVVVPGTSSDKSKAVEAAHIVATNGVFVVKSLSFVGTEGGQVIFSQTITHAENASFQGTLVTCNTGFSFTDPQTGQLATVAITAIGFFTPR